MTHEQQLKAALFAMWRFATDMADKHGMNGDDTMTDQEHKDWQDAAMLANAALNEANA